MKKVILTTLAIVVALSTVLSITGFAMAETETRPVEVEAERLGLAINAPAVVKAGESIRIQIVTRPGERPVPQAEVWAVNLNSLTNDTAPAADIASLSQANGILLGTTNERGYVDPAPSIMREGRYMLVAIKPNFAPGFAMIKVTSRVPLSLRAPDTAKAGQTVTMTVTGPDGQGIPRAAVFAIPLRNTDGTVRNGNYDQLLEDAEAYAEIIDNPDAEAELRVNPQAYNRIMEMRRYFIGFTDGNGQLNHAFDEAGPHLLIAAKRGYMPDFHIIKITGGQLELRAPDSAKAGEPVTMRVTESSGQGVYNAAIFAVPLLGMTDDTNSNIDQLLKEAEAYAQMLERPTVDGSPTTNERAYDSTFNIRRYLIGFTDRNGEFTYRFQQEGPYLLIAAKCGYTPDFHIIKITDKLRPTPMPAELAPMKVEEAQISQIK
jgi:uncharacterized GH25 family protein